MHYNAGIIGAGIIALDQLTKRYIEHSRPELLIANTGGLWGMRASPSVLLLLSLVIICGLFYGYLKSNSYQQRVAIMLVLGGIVSNMLDRIFSGAVRDFINVGWWPAFNFADAAIVCGVFWFIWLCWRKK